MLIEGLFTLLTIEQLVYEDYLYSIASPKNKIYRKELEDID